MHKHVHEQVTKSCVCHVGDVRECCLVLSRVSHALSGGAQTLQPTSARNLSVMTIVLVSRTRTTIRFNQVVAERDTQLKQLNAKTKEAVFSLFSILQSYVPFVCG